MHRDDESERGMEFTTENDYEGGRWIRGEFYSTAVKRQKRGQNSDEAIYGVFGTASSSDSGDEDGDGRAVEHSKGRRSSKRGRMSRNLKPVSFVSSSESTRPTAEEAPGQRSGEDSSADDESVRETFRSMIDTAVGSLAKAQRRADDIKDGAALLSNSDFRKMVEASSGDGTAGRGNRGQPTTGDSNLSTSTTQQEAAASLKGLGEWQKHTKGIGLKLLQKFGFNGRLGARGDGVQKPIEVTVRATNAGLGYGDEGRAASISKTIASVTVDDMEAKFGAKKTSSQQGGERDVTEKIIETKSWKRRHADKVKPQLLDPAAFLQAEDAAPAPLIIDMTGREARILTDLKSIPSAISSDHPSGGKTAEEFPSKPLLGQELLYNITLVANLMEVEVTNDSRKMANETRRAETLRAEVEALQALLDDSAPRLERLELLAKALQRIEDKCANDPAAISLPAISKAFTSLYTAFSAEFQLFGLVHLLPALAVPVVQSVMATWRPMEDPLRLAEIFAELSPLVSFFEDRKEPILAKQIQEGLESLLEKQCFAAVRRAISNEWVVTEPSACILIFESLSRLAPKALLDQSIDMLVLPKITSAVEKWSPTTDSIPIHTWLHPWLPILGSKLSVVYPEIRRKLGHCLVAWHASDSSAIAILRPWFGIFDQTSLDAFLVRSIVPKLVSAFRDAEISSTSLDTSCIAWIMQWRDVIPSVHFLSILEGEFFGKWLRVLGTWLTTDPDFGEVSSWYITWKGAFPADLLEREASLRQPIEMALELMNAALEGQESLQVRVSEVVRTTSALSYSKVLQCRQQESSMRNRLEMLNHRSAQVQGKAATGGGDMNLKELLESLAADNGVEFVPREGMGAFHDGKQLWTFGSVCIYFDQNVVFAKSKGQSAGQFIPVSLDFLLSMAK